MKIFYNNNADSGTVTATTENLDFPVTNIQDFIPSKLYKTSNTQTSEAIVFDLGNAYTPTGLIIFNHNLDGTETGLTLEANTSNSWGVPPFSMPLTFAASIIEREFNSMLVHTYRYWRLKFTKANATDVRSIGRVFLGTYFDADSESNPDYDGYTLTTNDLSISGKSIGGQTYTEEKSQFRTLELNFSMRSNSVKESFAAIYETVGTKIPVFVKVLDTSPLNEVLYMRITNNNTYKIKSWDALPSWDLALNLEEQI